MKINDTESLFKILSSGVTQGSIQAQSCSTYLLKLFYFLFFINEAILTNFADDNMIYAAKRDLNQLLKLLEKENEVAIKWFSDNNVTVNPKKFQAIIISRKNKSNHNCCLTINNVEIKSKESVSLLGIQIDNKLNFEKHVSTIFKRTNNQLNAISRIGTVLGQKEKKILKKNSFVYSNTAFLYGTLEPAKGFKSRKSSRKKSQTYIE